MLWVKNLTIDLDPDDKGDWIFKWEDWLAGDTIASYTITVETGLVNDGDSNTTSTVTVWLSGGTAGQTYTVACKITTAAGRIKERSVRFRIKQQ